MATGAEIAHQKQMQLPLLLVIPHHTAKNTLTPLGNAALESNVLFII